MMRVHRTGQWAGAWSQLVRPTESDWWSSLWLSWLLNQCLVIVTHHVPVCWGTGSPILVTLYSSRCSADHTKFIHNLDIGQTIQVSGPWWEWASITHDLHWEFFLSCSSSHSLHPQGCLPLASPSVCNLSLLSWGTSVPGCSRNTPGHESSARQRMWLPWVF